MKVDRFSKLLQIASENSQLAKVERDVLLLMMHIAQDQISIADIARLVKKLLRSDFLTYVAPNLRSPSKIPQIDTFGKETHTFRRILERQETRFGGRSRFRADLAFLIIARTLS